MMQARNPGHVTNLGRPLRFVFFFLQTQFTQFAHSISTQVGQAFIYHMSRPSIIRGRCEWENCRKWPVPGSKYCKEHVQATHELVKAATIDAIAIEKLELKAEAGEATQAQVIQRQRKSVATYSAAEQASNMQLKDRKPPGVEELCQQLEQDKVFCADQEAALQLCDKVLVVSGFSQPFGGLVSADVEHCDLCHGNELHFEIKNVYTEHNPDIAEALLATGEQSGVLYSNPDSYLPYLQQAFCALGGSRYIDEYVTQKACIRNLFQVWNADVVFVSAYLDLWEGMNVFIGGGTGTAVKFWQLYGKSGSRCYFYYDFADIPFHHNLRNKIAKARDKDAAAPHAWYEVSKADCCGDISLTSVEAESLRGVMHTLGGKVVAGIGGIGLTVTAKQTISDLYEKVAD
jgi:hypothetical protein